MLEILCIINRKLIFISVNDVNVDQDTIDEVFFENEVCALKIVHCIFIFLFVFLEVQLQVVLFPIVFLKFPFLF